MTVARPDVERELAKLKGFQRTTVEYAFDRLFRADDSSHRFLVADEVGLGKTLVARGIIVKAVDHLWDRADRIDVVYICSNTSIARQNVRRLSYLPEEETFEFDRLTLLPEAVRDLRQRKVNIFAFTPGTSFDLRSRGGTAQERVVLYWMLQSLWPDLGTGPKNLLQGLVTDPNSFRQRIQAVGPQAIDAAICKEFERVVRQRMVDEAREGHSTLEERYENLCRQFARQRNVTREERQDQFRFIGEMRSLLAATCIRALEPDLVVLDEFQRFRDLLSPNDSAGQLAHDLFNYSDEISAVRILLLSATPYKMYTLRHEEGEDDHYRDFLRTFEFISRSTGGHGEFRDLLAEYRTSLFRLPSSGDLASLVRLKEAIEASLRRHMCRTERVRTTEGYDGMLREVPSPPLRLAADEVRDFATLEAAARTVDQPGMVEYWKSAPYLLNFMDGYKVKQELVTELGSRASAVRPRLLGSPGLLMDWDAFEGYERLAPKNARLRWLESWLDSTEAWRLLWLPPTLPYWKLAGVFAKAAVAGLTKRLVFSGWSVVPKAIASMMSYEVERRIFREFESDAVNTPDARKKRQPLLRFQLSDGRLTGMPVLGWMYPSSSLARLIDPLTSSGDVQPDATRLLREAEELLGPRLARLTRKYAKLEGSREDEAWYWAAPILLDLEHSPVETKAWLEGPSLASFWASGSGEASDDEEADRRWSDHVDKAVELVNGRVVLGSPPADLTEVLTKLSLGGAGVCAARALSHAGLGGADPASEIVRDAAAYVAWGFRTLFNQPEAMALIRAGRDELPYWRMVIDYSIEGCLQAVLDEFAHLVRDFEGLTSRPVDETVSGIVDAISDVLTLRTTTARVDELNLQEASPAALIHQRRMRNHFALRFAAQEPADGATGVRIEHVRAAFNSPFWPFVLLTTAVGQEGLDFHAYCHAVVHWNLPSNPVDLEQREGRVHRFKGHAVRKNLVSQFGRAALEDSKGDAWERLFEIAVERGGQNGNGLMPFWIFPGDAAIERHVPSLPLSRESVQIDTLRRSLAVYRMVFGQPRQDDLMAFLLNHLSQDKAAELASSVQIDLSPRVGPPTPDARSSPGKRSGRPRVRSQDFLATDLHGVDDIECEVKFELHEDRMILELEDFASSQRYVLDGSARGSGFVTEGDLPSGKAAWALLGDVCIGHWRLGDRELLFFFHPPRHQALHMPRSPDFSVVGNLPLREVRSVRISFVEDADERAVFESDGSVVLRGNEMVLETPEDDEAREYVFVGALQPPGYFAGRDSAHPELGAIARWAPVKEGLVGLWREAEVDLFFWARLDE